MKFKKFRESNVANFIRVWKRDGRKETWKQFKIRFYEQQTPERLLTQQLYGQIGSICGLMFAITFLIFMKTYAFIPWLVFILWIQYVQLKGIMKQRKAFKEMKELYNE